MPHPQVISLSGGKDSIAMTLMMHERGEKIDGIIYADTGWDFPETHEEIARLEEMIKVKVTRVNLAHGFRYWMFDHIVEHLRDVGCHVGYGWPSHRARWCTTKKVRALDKYRKGTWGNTSVGCIGLTVDERRNRREGNRYPLVEYKVTQEKALSYCLSRGFTWGGLYDTFRHVSCFCCPLQGKKELKILRQHRPELWQEMLEMDARLIRPPRRPFYYGGLLLQELDNEFAAKDRKKMSTSSLPTPQPQPPKPALPRRVSMQKGPPM